MDLHAEPRATAPGDPYEDGPDRWGVNLSATVVAAVAALVIGLALGVFLLAPWLSLDEEDGRVPVAAPGGTQGPAVQWRVASAFPSTLPLQGTLGVSVARKINRASGGNLQVALYEPGALVPPLQMFDAVATGAIDAAWSTPGFWFWREKALALFSAVPFGPDAREYLAWIYYGGGQQLLDAIYGRYGVKSLICGIASPEAAGWFRYEVDTEEDLEGLRMRSMGLGAKVMERLGVSVQPISGANIHSALAGGTIDAAEYAQPAIDVNMGLDRYAKHYYFPGWQQQASLFELMINGNRWATLSDTQQALVELACGDTVREGLAQGEAFQGQALAELRRRGVTLHRWPSAFLRRFDVAWREVAADLAAEDSTFEAVWGSLQAFRADYALWRRLGYLE